MEQALFSDSYTLPQATLFSALAHNVAHNFIKVSVFQLVSELLHLPHDCWLTAPTSPKSTNPSEE